MLQYPAPHIERDPTRFHVFLCFNVDRGAVCLYRLPLTERPVCDDPLS